jgi:hypothetical protein
LSESLSGDSNLGMSIDFDAFRNPLTSNALLLHCCCWLEQVNHESVKRHALDKYNLFEGDQEFCNRRQREPIVA